MPVTKSNVTHADFSQRPLPTRESRLAMLVEGCAGSYRLPQVTGLPRADPRNARGG